MRPPMELPCKMQGPAPVPLWVFSGLLWPLVCSQLGESPLNQVVQTADPWGAVADHLTC